MPPNQADDFPGDPFPHPIPQQPQNAWVSFRPLVVKDVHSPPMCVPPQFPPFPANGQPEVHWEDVPPPVQGAAGPEARDPGLLDPAYQGVVDYHPQLLVGVSNPHPSATKSPFDQWRLGNRTFHMCSQMLEPEVSRARH